MNLPWVHQNMSQAVNVNLKMENKLFPLKLLYMYMKESK